MAGSLASDCCWLTASMHAYNNEGDLLLPLSNVTSVAQLVSDENIL
jgi:hypothetical protein